MSAVTKQPCQNLQSMSFKSIILGFLASAFVLSLAGFISWVIHIRSLDDDTKNSQSVFLSFLGGFFALNCGFVCGSFVGVACFLKNADHA